MKPTLAAGVAGTREFLVDRERTIDFMGEDARVYATPMLVRDIEVTCREMLLEHLDAGEDSVGTRVEIDHLAATLMGLTDTLFMGWVSTDAQAGVGLGGIVCWTFAPLFVGTLTVINTFVAQHVGAGARERCGGVVWSGVLLAVGFSGPIELTARGRSSPRTRPRRGRPPRRGPPRPAPRGPPARSRPASS